MVRHKMTKEAIRILANGETLRIGQSAIAPDWLTILNMQTVIDTGLADKYDIYLVQNYDVITFEVEAKDQELMILQLMKQLKIYRMTRPECTN